MQENVKVYSKTKRIKKKFGKFSLHYINILEKDDHFDPALMPLKSKNIYSVVAIDEFQDSAIQESKMLIQLCKGPAYFCGDPNQSFEYQKSKTPDLCTVLKNRPYKLFSLKDDHRSAQEIQRISYNILEMKRRVVGGVEDQFACDLIINPQQPQGCVKWINTPTLQLDQHPYLSQYENSHEFAVITLDEYKEEANKIFHTKLIFNEEEARGLQFKVVIIYRPLDRFLSNKIYEKINLALDQTLEFSQTIC